MMNTEEIKHKGAHIEKEPLLPNVSQQGEKSFARHIIVILPVCVLYSLGVIIYFYVAYEWIQDFEQSRYFPNGSMDAFTSGCGFTNFTAEDTELYGQVESGTAKWQMFASLGENLPAIVTVAILPAYSDCFGRRFILIIGCTGSLLKLIIATLTIYLNWHPIGIVVASLLEGFTGGKFTVMSGGYSYIADITRSGQTRTLGMSFFDGVMMLCIAGASLSAGYFIQQVGFFIPSATACAMVACSLILFIFAVPESYPKHKRSKARSVLTVLKGTFSFYFSDTFKAKRSAYVLLLTAYMLENIAIGPQYSLEMLYQLGRPFCWSSDKIGIFSALRHLGHALVGMFLVKPLHRCFSDLAIAVLSMTFASIAFVMEGLARTDAVLYMVAVVAACSYLCESMIKSLMSSMTPADKQGALFSSLVTIAVSCLTVSSFVFNTIYTLTIPFMSGFIFLLQAGICMLTMTILIIFSKKGHGKNKVTQEKHIKDSRI